MKNNQDLKRSLFIILVLILVGDFVLFLINGFFIWQLFLRPPAQESALIDIDAAVQATQRALEQTQTQEAALTLMAIETTQTTETMEPTPETTATLEEQQPTPTETPSMTPTEEGSPLDENRFYTVKAGDTVQSVAATFGISALAIRTSNKMAGDTLLIDQQIFIPEAATGSAWNYEFSNLPKAAQFTQAYAPSVDQSPRFTLYVDPAQYPANADAALYRLQTTALNHVETFYHESLLTPSFKVYVAGTLFDQERLLRSASYPDPNMIFVVYDGSGSKPDQLRLMTFEMARFFGEKTFGTAASSLLKEGAAMYIAQQNAAIFDSNVVPLREYCAAYLNDGVLPSLSDTGLLFKSELIEPINFHTAGCFYEFLSETASIETMKQLYTSGDYEILMEKSLDELTTEFRAWLAKAPEEQKMQPTGFTTAIQELSTQYQNFLPGFDGSTTHLEIYRELDLARTNLLMGLITEGQAHLDRAKQLIANSS